MRNCVSNSSGEPEGRNKKRNLLYLKSEYEYETVVINDLITGEIDSEKLQKTLESYALNGWRLHSVFTNEVGRNSGGSFTSFQGDFINAAPYLILNGVSKCKN